MLLVKLDGLAVTLAVPDGVELSCPFDPLDAPYVDPWLGLLNAFAAEPLIEDEGRLGLVNADGPDCVAVFGDSAL